MNHLLRSHAPISDKVWALLDEEARERLAPALAARKMVDFSGPHGWEHSATTLGRTSALTAAPSDGTSGRQRRILPLVELRADFELSREELRDADRGAEDVDLDALDLAAHQLAVAENRAVFHGWEAAGITGRSPGGPITVSVTRSLSPRGSRVQRARRAPVSAGATLRPEARWMKGNALTLARHWSS